MKTKIIACVNISKIDSVYSWNGKIQNSSEYIAIFKTLTKNKTKLKRARNVVNNSLIMNILWFLIKINIIYE